MAAWSIRPLESFEDMLRVEDLQRAVWPGSERGIVPAHLLLTMAHNGGVVLGAFEGGALTGFVFGFLGTDPSSPDRVAMARLKLCSHMLGVHPEREGRGLGFDLKIAQRRAVLQQGIRLITWTYDPLLSRNAHLNIRRLGAVCRTYLRNAYGEMEDELNAGLPSDRFLVDWWVTSNRVNARLESSRPPLDLAHYLAAGVPHLNPASLGPDNLPRPFPSPLSAEGNLLLVEIPSDFASIKSLDPGLALAWREHTRQVFETVFSAGYLVTDFIHLKGERFPRSFYLLSFGEGTLG